MRAAKPSRSWGVIEDLLLLCRPALADGLVALLERLLTVDRHGGAAPPGWLLPHPVGLEPGPSPLAALLERRLHRPAGLVGLASDASDGRGADLPSDGSLTVQLTFP